MSSRSEPEAIADQFDAERFLAAEGCKKLATLQAATWPEEAEFHDDLQFVRGQLKRLVSRIGEAIDLGLLDEPEQCGAAGWAIGSFASQLCKHPQSAEILIDAWRNYDYSELFEYLARPDDAPANQKKRRA